MNELLFQQTCLQLVVPYTGSQDFMNESKSLWINFPNYPKLSKTEKSSKMYINYTLHFAITFENMKIKRYRYGKVFLKKTLMENLICSY